MVSLTPWLLSSREESPWYRVNRRLGGCHSQSGHFENYEKIFSVLEIKPQFLSHPFYSLVTISPILHVDSTCSSLWHSVCFSLQDTNETEGQNEDADNSDTWNDSQLSDSSLKQKVSVLIWCFIALNVNSLLHPIWVKLSILKVL